MDTFSTMHCACWDVDAYDVAGIYTADLDNGVMVTLGDINKDTTTQNIKGFEYNVAPAQATSKGVWVVASPEVGTDIMMQELADPRQFYNVAGQGMSVKYLVPGVDVIEVSKECFTNSTLPTATNKTVIIGAGGKLTAQSAAAAADGSCYFDFIGYHNVAIGMETVQMAVLRCARN